MQVCFSGGFFSAVAALITSIASLPLAAVAQNDTDKGLGKDPVAVHIHPKSVVGTAGYFRVGRSDQGQWWFVDADGKPFFYRGVTSVNQDGWGTKRADGSSYDQVVAQKYGANFGKAAIARLRSWGFNAIGGVSGPETWDQGMPYTVVLNFTKDDKSPKIDGTFLPDVFDPTWPRRMDEIAATLCAPRKNSRELVGYFTDNELSWAQVRSENKPLVFDPSESTLRDSGQPSLLQLCLSLPDARPASRAAWEFVLARHGGDLARVAADWKLPALDNKRRIGEWTAAKKVLLSPGYLSDDEAWSRTFGERYFRLTAEAVRRQDPNHLILGCRFGAPPGPAVLAACRRPWVDVVSANNYRDTFYERMDIYARGTGLPVLNTEFAWVTDYFTKERDADGKVTGEPAVARMLKEGRISLEKALEHPQMVGYTWYRWVDKADFKPPISYGLVSVKDEPNGTHLGVLKEVNARADALHHKVGKRNLTQPPATAPLPSSASTYPDEAGFRRRTAGMLAALAKRPVGEKCKALSICPDTGLRVHTFAVQGETVYSPYTGRAYVQGDTGYFGPKARGEDGRITAFGGDPLKQDLPPAIARLLLDPKSNPDVKAFLSVPGSLRQQYHFAAANWARFYPLLSEKAMNSQWRADFKAAVAAYTENRRPADGARENLPMTTPHDLIGEPGELLGGNVTDGGTENHKTMWRTSGLLYAQILGADAVISGQPAAEAERRITPMLTGFLRTILTVGNGEYDSSTYYPYSLRAYLNLYDFSPKAQTRALARTMLDYYLASYALKCVNGVHAGAEKRGWSGDGDTLSEMDANLWAWAGATTIPVDTTSLVTSIQQATTTYRPNRILHHLLTRNIGLPFEAQMARPSYHSKDRNVFQETYYGAKGFGLGSVALTAVDNPGQQTVWRLVCSDKDRALVFGGGQPRFRHPEGHSPYDQTLQKRGTLILLTGPTETGERATLSPEQQARFTHAAVRLAPEPNAPVSDPAALAAWWDAAPNYASSWLFVPRGVTEKIERKSGMVLAGGNAFVAVYSLGESPRWVRPEQAGIPDSMAVLRKYGLLTVPASGDGFSGYVIDVADRATYPSLSAFADIALANPPRRDGRTVTYHSLAGDDLTMTYQPTGFRAVGTINRKPVDWANWANGGVFESPYVKIKDGAMVISDGRDSYTLKNEENF